MTAYLRELNDLVGELTGQPRFRTLVQELKSRLPNTIEPFVWSTLHGELLDRQLPDAVKSAWVFVLKREVPSECHYHPNSIQHMVMIEGRGRSRVGDNWKKMIRFGTSESLRDLWYVIDRGVPHEFFPEETDMVVVSFHTCEANDLEEIACETGAKRLYDGAPNGS